MSLDILIKFLSLLELTVTMQFCSNISSMTLPCHVCHAVSQDISRDISGIIKISCFLRHSDISSRYLSNHLGFTVVIQHGRIMACFVSDLFKYLSSIRPAIGIVLALSKILVQFQQHTPTMLHGTW